MFSNPQIQQAMEQRLLESLMPTKKDPWKEAMRAGGTALINTPGNFLQGLAASTAPAAEAHAAASTPDKASGTTAMKLLDDMLNLGKAESLDKNRTLEHERRLERDAAISKNEQGRLSALLEGLGIKKVLADSLIERRGVQNENDVTRIGIAQQNADTTERRTNESIRQGDDRIEIARKRAETDAKRVSSIGGAGANPDRIYNEAQRIIQAERKNRIPDRSTSTEDDYQAAVREYEQWERSFVGGLSPEVRDKFSGGGQAAGGPAKIGSKAEFDALPSGTQFIAPDGSVRIKP